MSDFLLIETMRWQPGTGIVRLPLHMARLKKSARQLEFADADRAEEKLAEALAESLPPSALPGISPSREEIAGSVSSAKVCSNLISPLEGEMSARPTEGGSATPTSALRIRLTLSPTGEIAVTTAPFSALPENTVWRVAMASTRLSSEDSLLRHKTSRRDLYEAARREYETADADEVLLLNENGEPCEGTITSLFLDDGSGILKTPPISNGLLAGVLRTELICQRRARVQRLSREDLGKGTVYMGNSLRGLIRAQFMKED